MKNVILLTWLTLLSFIVLFPSSNIIAQDFCKGDFNYDGNVDATDVLVFLQNFGRSRFNNPCPSDGPAPVPQTGQTTSYANGDDGNLKKGIAWPNPRFTDNDDGTVTDNLTGLIWLKNANCFGTRMWNNALSDCNGLTAGYCGLTDGSSAGDWRLPNRYELESLLDMKNDFPALPSGHPFALVPSGIYWSSTTVSDVEGIALYVSMSYGGVSDSIMSDSYYVWPVRGGH